MARHNPNDPIIVRVRRERNIYAILGIAPDADAATVKTAYLAAARAIHPDTLKSDDATALMQKLNRVYDFLSDPARRAKYDAKQKAKIESSPSPEKADNAADTWHDIQNAKADAELRAWRARQEAGRYRRQRHKRAVIFFWYVLCVVAVLVAYLAMAIFDQL